MKSAKEKFSAISKSKKKIYNMKFQPPKGTRDFMPKKAAKFQKLIDLFRSVAEKYGFSPAITPAFESFELLSAKGGLGEAVKDEIYYFKDKSDRELGLRFDLTMPLARIVATNPQMPKPFKRYVVDKVWRYDNPQALRWREFWQADVDTVGTDSLIADVECLAVVCEFLEKLGFDKFYIRVNNRKMLQSIFEKIIGKDKLVDAFRAIDKLEKIGLDGVRKELENRSIETEKILDLIQIAGSNKDIIKKVRKLYRKNEGLNELKQLLQLAKKFGIENRLKIDLSLVRGLEYYTGVVFEVFLGAKVSCGGGGRYDNLIETIGGQPTPATGISLGLDRIFELMKENKMVEEKAVVKAFVANVDEKTKGQAMKIAQKLRKKGINCQIDLMNRNLTKQLEYADRTGIPYVIIVGAKELKSKKFKLKDMKMKTEKELTLREIVKELK